MSDYKLMFFDQGDLIFIDEVGGLVFRKQGEEDKIICSARNVEALVEFLRSELMRLPEDQNP